MLGLTSLGNPPCVVTVFASTLIRLCLKRRFSEAKFWAIAGIGAQILIRGLKLFFASPRPDLWTRLISEQDYSFPSGHALGSFVLYGFLAYLLAVQFPRFSRLIYGVAIVAIAGIGLSRLYLGVHWPTDIMGGYSVAYIWLTVCITLFKLRGRSNPRRTRQNDEH